MTGPFPPATNYGPFPPGSYRAGIDIVPGAYRFIAASTISAGTISISGGAGPDTGTRVEFPFYIITNDRAVVSVVAGTLVWNGPSGASSLVVRDIDPVTRREFWRSTDQAFALRSPSAAWLREGGSPGYQVRVRNHDDTWNLVKVVGDQGTPVAISVNLTPHITYFGVTNTETGTYPARGLFDALSKAVVDVTNTVTSWVDTYGFFSVNIAGLASDLVSANIDPARASASLSIWLVGFRTTFLHQRDGNDDNHGLGYFDGVRLGQFDSATAPVDSGGISGLGTSTGTLGVFESIVTATGTRFPGSLSTAPRVFTDPGLWNLVTVPLDLSSSHTEFKMFLPARERDTPVPGAPISFGSDLTIRNWGQTEFSIASLSVVILTT
jgi:hypothetical protein